jgi:signal transduction histidine kinase
MDPNLLRQVTESLGIERAIFAPLSMRGRTQGLLVVAGAGLTEADAPAIETFANQAGIALENARLVDQLTTSGEELQVMARRVLTAQEEERQRLSRALHDEAGQALTALKINLELLAQDLPPGNRPLAKRVTDSATMVDSTMDQIRHLAQGLRPPALDALGLDPTLEGYCQDFSERTHIDITYQGGKLPALAEPVSITLYRFLQEALTNIARHANARQVNVVLRHDAEEISLIVEDDGEGFVPGLAALVAGKNQGLGLLGMEERLELLGGRLEIDSEPGRGTQVAAYIRLEE